MGSPIDRTSKTTLDSNLVNGVTSDAPKVKANNDVLYNYVDTLNNAIETAAAATTLPHTDGSVTGPKIRDGAVTTAKIADGAVTATKILDGVLTSAKFVAGALTNETENALRITAVEDDLDALSSGTAVQISLKADQADLDVTNATMALKANTTYVDTQVAAVASGSPKGTYATLVALQTAFPTGTTGIYVVIADGKWYYWSGSAWTAGGTYQATGLAEDDVYTLMGLPNPEPNVSMTNLMTNGNFVDPAGWAGNNATVAVTSNVATVTGNGAHLAPRIDQGKAIVSGKKYLVRAKVRVTNAVCQSMRLEWYNGASTQNIATIPTPSINTDYILSGVITATNTATGVIWINQIYADATTANGKEMKIQYVSAVDVTDILANNPNITNAMLINSIEGITNGFVNGTQLVAVKGYSNGKVLAQVNGVVKMATLDELASPAIASQVTITDSANSIIATNVEDALQEVVAKVNSLSNLNGANIRPVIIDTDFWTDPDDSLAIRIALWAERHGMIDIVGICLDAIATNSVRWLDGFLNFEGRPGLCIGADKQATDYTGSPTMTNNWRSDYTSNDQAEDCVQFYRRALTSVTGKVDIFAIGFLNALSRLLQSPPDEYSSLTGLQLVTQKVNHLWCMGGKYPSGSEHNFNHNARAKAAAKYVCDNWPTEITFLGWEVSISVKIATTLRNIYDSTDLMVQALTAYGDAVINGKESWDPMLTLMACYNNLDTAGYDTVRGTNTVDVSTGANIFVTSSTGKHRYVVKRYPDKWYVQMMDRIIEKNAWLYRPLGAQQLPKP